MNKAIVNNVHPYSIAEDLDILPGDEIISIDEVKPIDLIDYQYLVAPEEISLHIKRTSLGEEEIIDIEKDLGEDLGIVFESAVFDKVIPCNNKCIFCFVDQQPEGLRDSLYIKDDDYRLSFLQGTYVTLTNLRDKDRKRIEDLKLGPLYVSVHTTNPELRQKMLNNPKAGTIMEELVWLESIDIPVHTQIVLCPGVNDGKELERNLKDLAGFENVQSVAVVPVGITKYRDQSNFGVFTKESASSIIELAQKYDNVFPSDEFYITAGMEFPNGGFYDGFCQLEDGVGAGRLLLDDYESHKSELPESLPKPLSITVASGELAYKILHPIINDLNKIHNLNIELVSIKSRFWGDKVTVSGLVTGQDLLNTLDPIKDKIENLIIPAVMLRKCTDQFLDNMTIDEIESKLDVNVKIIENYYSTEELIDFINTI